MVYYCHKLFLFGGINENKEILNDFWSLDFKRSPLIWEKIIPLGKLPAQRIYHSMNLYKYYHDEEIIIIFGGRDKDSNSLSDIFGIKNNKSNWEFCDFQENKNIKKSKNFPLNFKKSKIKFDYPIKDHSLKSVHHRSIIIGPFLFVTGGEKNSEENNIWNLNVFSMKSMKWYFLGNLNLYRHSIFEYQNIKSIEDYDIFIYAFGGLNSETNEFNKDLIKIDVIELFSKDETLNNELDDYVNSYVSYKKEKEIK